MLIATKHNMMTYPEQLLLMKLLSPFCFFLQDHRTD